MIARQVRPKDRKGSIVEAAAVLFAERGFAAVGMDDIGAAVGVSGPAIYRHFRGKDAVLASVVTAAAEAVADAVETSSRRTGASSTAEIVRGAVGLALDRPALLATYLRERQRVTGDASRAVSVLERRVRAAWTEVMTEALPDLAVDSERLRLRQSAITGGLSAATRGPAGVARPDLDELLVASAVAVMQVPTSLTEEPAALPAWTPPPGRREEILTAALHLLATRGFHGVGIDELGEAAGISGPTMYHYYGSKADLLVDAYDRVGQRVAVGVESALASASSAADALERLARSYAAIAVDSADLIVVTSREGFALPESERPRLSRRRQAVRDRWLGVLRELRPELSENEARLLVRIVFPLVNHAAQAVPGRSDLAAEVAGLAAAHCRGC